MSDQQPRGVRGTLGCVGGGIALVALVAGPMVTQVWIFTDEPFVPAWPYGVRALVAVLVIVVHDYLIHGFKLAGWRADRRTTWSLCAVGFGNFVYRCPWLHWPHRGWQRNLLQAGVFLIFLFLLLRDTLRTKDWYRYEDETKQQ